jgi:hypothetical protein
VRPGLVVKAGNERVEGGVGLHLGGVEEELPDSAQIHGLAAIV